jgi:hypothetical protein
LSVRSPSARKRERAGHETLRGGIADAVRKRAAGGTHRYVTGAGPELTTIGPEAEEEAAQATAEGVAAEGVAGAMLGATMEVDAGILALAGLWCSSDER